MNGVKGIKSSFSYPYEKCDLGAGEFVRVLATKGEKILGIFDMILLEKPGIS